MGKGNYKTILRDLQIGLVRLQRHLIEHSHKIVVIFEGRDASGKDGLIKRITQHLSPRETRVVALPAPSDRDKSSWYFQRYVSHLPAAQEMVLFNRSWYNRAGVEPVMGFCSEEEYKEFLAAAPIFERMLVDSGIQIFKYYLDISRNVQIQRLMERSENSLTQWKSSPIDARAVEKWDDYTRARDTMLAATHTSYAPWIVVNANRKKLTRLNVIQDILERIPCPEKHSYRHSHTSRKIIQIYHPDRPNALLHP